MANPVVHFEIGVADRGKAKDFYSQLFDWKINDIPNMDYTIVTAEEKGIGGGFWKPKDDKPYITLYILVDDLQKFLDKAEKLGGKILMEPTEIPEVGSTAMFEDPDGNMIGLWKELEKKG